MLRVIGVFLLAILAAGGVACANVPVSPRTPTGALVFDNETGDPVYGLGICSTKPSPSRPATSCPSGVLWRRASRSPDG